jgi:hypothetical protein
VNCVKNVNTYLWKVVCVFELSGLNLIGYIKSEHFSMNLRLGDWTEMKIALSLKPLKFTGYFSYVGRCFQTDSNVLCVTYRPVRNKVMRVLLLSFGNATEHILSMTSHLDTNTTIRSISLFTATI